MIMNCIVCTLHHGMGENKSISHELMIHDIMLIVHRYRVYPCIHVPVSHESYVVVVDLYDNGMKFVPSQPPAPAPSK